MSRRITESFAKAKREGRGAFVAYLMKCGRMMVSEGDYCLDCQNHEMEFDRAFSPLAYNG